MKAFTVATIISICFVSLAALPVPVKIASGKNSNKLSDFSFVRTHRQGKGVEVCWSFTSTDAVGFSVQRTNEDPTDPYSVWIDVSRMQFNSSRSYKCHDDNPFPGFINYRVIAFMSDGSFVTSPISTVHIMAH